MGPVVSKVQWDKIQGLIQKGIDEGAKLVCGGTGLPEGVDAGHYVKPTVFSEANNDMTISREEIFGPVLTMIPYDSEEEAIRIANDTPYGLQVMSRAVIWTMLVRWRLGSVLAISTSTAQAVAPIFPLVAISSQVMAESGVLMASLIT